jgi:hypothetical protein
MLATAINKEQKRISQSKMQEHDVAGGVWLSGPTADDAMTTLQLELLGTSN